MKERVSSIPDVITAAETEGYGEEQYLFHSDFILTVLVSFFNRNDGCGIINQHILTNYRSS